MNKLGIPDYKNIEIKTRRTYSKSHLTLFNAVPDGEEQCEIERLKNTYGYPCKKDRRFKVLYLDVNTIKLNFGGIKYQYKLNVDRNEQKLYLCIYDKCGNLIERKIYWSFKYLKEKIYLKLNYLAIVNAWTNKKDNWNYFKYYKINFYQLKSFEKFLELIDDGTIRITLKIGIYYNAKFYGKTYDHGCGFAIKESDIAKLYSKIYMEGLK